MRPFAQVDGDLDFGVQVLNDTVKRSLTLTNTGLLPADFAAEPDAEGVELQVRALCGPRPLRALSAPVSGQGKLKGGAG